MVLAQRLFWLGLVLWLTACGGRAYVEPERTMVPSDGRKVTVVGAPVAGLITQVHDAYAREQWVQGRSILERVIRLSPQHGEAWHLMAWGYYKTGERAKAQRFARRAAELLRGNTNLSQANNALLQRLAEP